MNDREKETELQGVRDRKKDGEWRVGCRQVETCHL